MKRIVFFIIINYVVATNVFAQFYSEKLQNLYNLLPQSIRLDSTYCDTIIFKNYFIGGDTAKIVYEIDKNCFMKHCGYRFFNDVEAIDFGKNVVKFIESELLNLLITNDVQSVLTNWYEKKISFQFNNSFPNNDFFANKQQLLRIFNNAIHVNIDKKEQYFLVTLFCADSNRCHFAISINDELISGMNKKERDNFLSVQLSSFTAKQNYIKEIDNSFLKIFKDSLFVYEGSYYMIPEINNNLYFQKNDSSLILIASKELAEETFVNSLLLQTSKDYTINIKHKKYGRVVDNYTVCSSDFFYFFYNDFDNYFGIEEYDVNSGKLAGTLIFRNKETDYINLGYVTCTIDDLLQAGNISIELYSNIPQRNLSNLFGEKK